MPKIRHIRLNMLCCDRYVRAVKSIKRLRTHTRTIRIRIFNVDALVSAILTVFYFSSFLFIYLYLYFIGQWKMPQQYYIGSCLYCGGVWRKRRRKKWQLISVKTLSKWMSSSHSDQVVKIVVKFISASATTIVIYFTLNKKFEEKKNENAHTWIHEKKAIRTAAVAVANKSYVCIFFYAHHTLISI